MTLQQRGSFPMDLRHKEKAKTFRQKRTASRLTSLPPSWSKPSAFRSDKGNRTYMITARRMISGLVLNYANGGFGTGQPCEMDASSSAKVALTPLSSSALAKFRRRSFQTHLAGCLEADSKDPVLSFLLPAISQPCPRIWRPTHNR